jgi:hypothetical protein
MFTVRYYGDGVGHSPAYGPEMFSARHEVIAKIEPICVHTVQTNMHGEKDQFFVCAPNEVFAVSGWKRDRGGTRPRLSLPPQ